MKDPSELEELISIYALGALEGDELEEVERLLASGDPEAREFLEKYQDVASHLSYSSRGRMPDTNFRKKVLNEILGPPQNLVAETKIPFWKRFQLIGFSFGAAVAAMLVLVLFPTNDSFNQQIADQLVIGVSTVKKHINHIYSKLNVTSRTQAIAKARKHKLL